MKLPSPDTEGPYYPVSIPYRHNEIEQVQALLFDWRFVSIPYRHNEMGYEEALTEDDPSFNSL